MEDSPRISTLGRIVDDYPVIKKQLFEIQDTYGVAQNIYASCYPSFGVRTDARLTVFAKCANVVASTHFGVHFMIENMLNEVWWKKTEPWANQLRKNSKYDIPNDIREYDVFLKVSLLTQHFRAIESSFRDYVRAKWSRESSDATGNFTKVYSMLVKKLKLQQEHAELLDLYNETRNLMHNNGVYYPWNSKLNQTKTLPYRGKSYVFDPKKIAEFTDWSFVIMLVRDCVDLLLEVVNHNEIASLAKIRDSFGEPEK